MSGKPSTSRAVSNGHRKLEGSWRGCRKRRQRVVNREARTNITTQTHTPHDTHLHSGSGTIGSRLQKLLADGHGVLKEAVETTLW